MTNAVQNLVQIGRMRRHLSLDISNNPALTTLGTAFPPPDRRPAQLNIEGNPRLTDFENFRNLTCHGGIYEYERCPSWLINTPRCLA